MGSLGSHGDVLGLLINKQLQIILVVDHSLHVFSHRVNFILVLVVALLISSSLVLHLPHFGSVLSNSILRLFHRLLLFGNLLLSLCELQVRLRVNLVLLVQLLIQVQLVSLVLLIDFGKLSSRFFGSFLSIEQLIFEIRAFLSKRLEFLSEIHELLLVLQ